jgi:hypothetical protein
VRRLLQLGPAHAFTASRSATLLLMYWSISASIQALLFSPTLTGFGNFPAFTRRHRWVCLETRFPHRLAAPVL